ncbi:hypothetical protein C0995_005807 [Termitomyces sp. Mi166|nr:hypothetical protein C0995_005807 [Termitomyces sp. Mi166\
MAPAPTPGKEKAKVTEEDDDNEDKVMQKLQEELENFVVTTTALQSQHRHYKANIGLLQGTKILAERRCFSNFIVV